MWAETPEKAALEIGKRYPKTFGFYMTNLEKVKPLSLAGPAEPEEEAGMS